MAPTPAGLDPVKPKVVHPRLALPNVIRCQTSLNSLIYGANFRNYVRVTDSNLGRPGPRGWQSGKGGRCGFR